MNKFKKFLSISLMLLTVVSVSSCKKKEAPVIPITVVVSKIVAKDMPLSHTFVGQLSGSLEVEVRARIKGILIKRYYKEGSFVKKGQLLFLIDPIPYQIALKQAKAELEKAKANLNVNLRNRDRIVRLFKQNAVSQKDRDDAVNNYEVSKADVNLAKANTEEARVNLGYTRVTAPISGISSKETVSEGSLITDSGENNLLTKINQLNPIYINFSYSDNEILELRSEIKSGALVLPENDKMIVEVVLSDGSVYDKKGKINFNEASIDTSTGTLQIRAEVENPDETLLPGQFVKVILKGAVLKNAVIIPKRSVIQTGDINTVFVVNAKGEAEPRSVVLGDLIKDNVIVKSGLKDGETIVIDGLVRIKPHAKVMVIKTVPND